MQTHPPSAAGLVMVDFDGTIVPWGALEKPVPFEGAAEALQNLKALGFRIGIFTSRLSPTWHRAEGRDPLQGAADQTSIIARCLRENDIPFDFITAEKMPAMLYLDDKAMRVNAQRPLLSAIEAFVRRGDAAL